MSWDIKSKDNEVKFSVGKVEHNDEWMQERYVTVTIESPYPIDFAIGDYLIYRGERFEINYDPGKIKSAPRFEKGDAFKYENVKFNSLADELTRCDFLDVVLGDNQLHFTGLPKFSFYGGVMSLAERIQANLDRAYGKDVWCVEVDTEFSSDTELNVTVDTIKVSGALEILVNEFKTYYTIKGRTLTIGAAGVPADHLFKYGPGQGLYEIEENAEADQQIVTRLRAYGSTRNLPYRWYHSLTGADGKAFIPDDLAVHNLMLPGFPETTQDPYIDSPNKVALGIREGTIFFDGSGELEEIYPSIEGMTAEQLKAAGETCNATGVLDVLVSAEQMTDNGVGKIEGEQLEGNTETEADPKTFKVTIKDVGFDINNQVIAENSSKPSISFKSGMLGGRDFEIAKCSPLKNNGETTGYELELNRVYDEDIKLWYPYERYNAKKDDKFVLLNIKMPEVYIKAASQRLKEAAEKWLAKNDYSRSIYNPKIDENFMARQHDAAMASGGTIKSLHDTLTAGMQLLFEDEDLGIDAAIFIDRLTIIEGEGPIPTYEVVLKEEKTVGRLDKMQNQIDSLAAGQGQGSGGYTAAQIRALIDAYGGTRFLSKIKNDRTPYMITADKGFRAGEYVAGYSGAEINEYGEAEFQSIFSRSYLKVFELIYNRINALEGDFSFSDSGTIESIQEVSNGRLRCFLRSRWDGDFNAFQPGDIIYGFVNNLDKPAPNGGYQYGKAWATVNSVSRVSDNNYIEVTPFPDMAVPGRHNLSLTHSMIITRHGNNITPSVSSAAIYPSFIKADGNGGYINERQRSFLISATDGNIRYLHGVSTPDIKGENIAMVLGVMPKGLFDGAIEEMNRDGMPGIYAKRLIVQDLLRVDYRGLTIRTQNYRGKWSGQTAMSKTQYYATTLSTYDVVSYDGFLYQCDVTGTLSRPDADDSGWTRIIDNSFSIYSIESDIAQIHVDENGQVTNSGITLTVIRHSRDAERITTLPRLEEEGLRLVYSYDGADTLTAENSSDPLETEDGTDVLEAEGLSNTLTGDGGLVIDLPADNVRPLNVALINTETGIVVSRLRIDVVRDGKRGAFKSTAFTRKSSKPRIPKGGDYDNPVPDMDYDGGSGYTVWSDGIPEGDDILWAVTRTFGGLNPDSEWSEPQQMTDTADFDVEFSTLENPSLPTGHPNTNPEWSNNATSDTIWMATSRRRNGKWGAWSKSKIKGEKGEPGNQGEPGDWTSYVFKKSETQPSAPTGTNPLPSGWSDAPSETGKWWMSKATVSGSSGKAGSWSVPIQATGEDGKDGAYTDFKYRKGTLDSAPTLTKNSRHPRFWSDEPDELDEDEYLWMTTAEINADDTLKTAWSSPVRISGERGKQGLTGPMAYPAGEYSELVTYSAVGGARPVVLYEGEYYCLLAGQTWHGEDEQGMTPASDASTEGRCWEHVDKFSTVFADIIMANFAKLSKAIFYGDYMFSQEGVDHDGNTTSDYHDFNELNPTSKSNEFIPNMLFNLKKGDIYGRKAILGNVEFSGGTIENKLAHYRNYNEIGYKTSIPYKIEDYTTNKADTNVNGVITKSHQFMLASVVCNRTGEFNYKISGRFRVSGKEEYVNGTGGEYHSLEEATFAISVQAGTHILYSNEITRNIEDPNFIQFNVSNIKDTLYTGVKYNIFVTVTSTIRSYRADKSIKNAATTLSFTFDGIEEVDENKNNEYETKYLKDGLIVGLSDRDYLMMWPETDGDGNERTQVMIENGNGFGLGVTNAGLQVRDVQKQRFGWMSLEDYIKKVMNT